MTEELPGDPALPSRAHEQSPQEAVSALRVSPAIASDGFLQNIAEAIAAAEGIPWRNRGERQRARLLKIARALLPVINLEIENIEADAANDAAHLGSLKRAMRELRALFAEFGVSRDLPWPVWVSAIRARLAQGIEAGTAETGTGSVHESPVGDEPMRPDDPATIAALQRQLAEADAWIYCQRYPHDVSPEEMPTRKAVRFRDEAIARHEARKR